jgi:sec-independent protein translocase protein TatB
MFSLGFGEILVICVILILVVGPERLPTVMKSVGRTMRTVREASREIRSTVGLDELMRDDLPRPVYRPPPPATVARIDSLPAATEANAAPAADAQADPAEGPAVAPSPASNDSSSAAAEPAPAVEPAPDLPPSDPNKAGV